LRFEKKVYPHLPYFIWFWWAYYYKLDKRALVLASSGEGFYHSNVPPRRQSGHSKIIGPLLNKAEACSAALEPTDKVQFDQESGLRREACRLLLSIKNEVYSQKTDSHPLGQCNKRHQQAFRCLVIISINLRARKTMDCLGCITQLRIYSKGERNKVYISYYT